MKKKLKNKSKIIINIILIMIIIIGVSSIYLKNDTKIVSLAGKLLNATNSNVVENIIGKVKFALSNTDGVLPNDLNVYLQKIADDGIEIGIFFNTNIVSYYDYLSFCEQVNLLLLKVLESENVKLAYPTQKVYVADKNDFNENSKKITSKSALNNEKIEKMLNKEINKNIDGIVNGKQNKTLGSKNNINKKESEEEISTINRISTKITKSAKRVTDAIVKVEKKPKKSKKKDEKITK